MSTQLGADKTRKVLISMSVPISIGMLSTFLFQVVDTFFIGKLGAYPLAALSFSSTLYFFVVALFIGLSVGVSTIIGKASGAGESERIQHITAVALLVCLLLSMAFSYLGINFVEPLFEALGANPDTIPLIKAYIVPLFYGIPMLMLGIMCGGILRATGNIKLPEIIMGIAGIINLIFDYLLIFGNMGFPEMGIQGAAYATVLSWVFVIIGMLVLVLKDRLLSGNIRKMLTNSASIIMDIFRLGSPIVITQIAGPLTLMYITFLLAGQSAMAVAAFGIAGRLETLLLIGVLGVSTALTPFIAQNLGAKQHTRIDEAIAFGGKASTYSGLLLCLLLYLFIKPIAHIFSNDSQVIQYTSKYFYIVSLSYVLYGLFVITSSIFNGLQLPVNSLKIMLIRSFVFAIPLTLIGSRFGVEGIFIGLSVSNMLAGIYAAYQMRREFHRANSPLAQVNVLQEYKKDIQRVFGKLK